jgi:hypothetical protein
MKTFLAYLVGAIGVFAVTAIFATYGFFASAFVGMHLWNWFAVSTFGLPAITMLQSLGIGLVLSFYTYQYVSPTSDDERELSSKVTSIVALCLRPWMILLVGYFIHRLTVG